MKQFFKYYDARKSKKDEVLIKNKKEFEKYTKCVKTLTNLD